MEHVSCELLPLVGIRWNGRLISFGADRAQADEVLGQPEVVQGSRCFYAGQELRLDFDDEGRLEFAECLGGCEGKVQPEICGVLAFQTDADELLTLLKAENHGPVDETEAAYCYGLLRISTGLFRTITPEDVEEMRREAGDEGVADLEKELLLARRWESIGIGRENYYLR